MRLIITLVLTVFTWQASADLVLYTDRSAERMGEVASRFEKSTGTKVVVLQSAYVALKERLDLEGVDSPADVILVKDLVYLGELSQNGWFVPMKSSFVESAVAPSLRDPKGLWTTVSFRARTLVYDANMDVSSINTYADLADPKWAGTLCLASSSASYNEGLVAQLISFYGEQKASNIVKGWVANQAVDPQVEDKTILRSIDNGDCSLAIINSYYLGAELTTNPSYAGKIKFLNQQDGGVFVNGVGAGVASTSKQPALAAQFVEFLLSEDIQNYLTGLEMTFPANKNVLPKTVIANWGSFIISPLNLSDAYPHVEKANAIMLEANWK
jgi:iron(III) transport system substrate-binding protein